MNGYDKQHRSRVGMGVDIVRIRIRDCALVLLCGGLLPATLLAADTLTVATLNCEFLVRRKVHMRYGLNFDPGKWTAQQRAEWTPDHRDQKFRESAMAVAAVIRRIDADLIGLVEVGNERDVRELYRYVQAPGKIYPHLAIGQSSDTATGQNVAVMSRIPITRALPALPGREFYDRELDDPDSEDDTGVSKGMWVQIQADGAPIYIYVLHLSSERGGHEKDAQRIAQASIVRRNYLRQLVAGEHVIVMGDLNDHRGQPALRRIRGRDDIQEDLLQTAGPTFVHRRGGESYAEYGRRLSNHWTYEFNGQRLQLDHVLISHSLKARCQMGGKTPGIAVEFLDAVSEKTMPQPVSDHRAVKLRLQFADPATNQSR